MIGAALVVVIALLVLVLFLLLRIDMKLSALIEANSQPEQAVSLNMKAGPVVEQPDPRRRP